MLKVRVVLLMPENGSISVKAGYPPEDTLDDADLAAANGHGETIVRLGVAPTRCPEQNASSCRCIPGAEPSA